jgi:hypothetical protein
MKFSLALAALIVAGFVALGWPQQVAVNRLRDEHAALAAEAAALGLATEDATAGQTRRRSAARVHLDREGEAKTMRPSPPTNRQPPPSGRKLSPPIASGKNCCNRFTTLGFNATRLPPLPSRKSTASTRDRRPATQGGAISESPMPMGRQ